MVDSAGRNEQSGGDLRVAQSLREQVEDLGFTFGEAQRLRQDHGVIQLECFEQACPIHWCQHPCILQGPTEVWGNITLEDGLKVARVHRGSPGLSQVLA